MKAISVKEKLAEAVKRVLLFLEPNGRDKAWFNTIDPKTKRPAITSVIRLAENLFVAETTVPQRVSNGFFDIRYSSANSRYFKGSVNEIAEYLVRIRRK